MKLDPVIVCPDGSILEEVNPNDSGVYCIFRIPGVKRGIRGKTRAKVDEVLIIGVPWSRAPAYLAKYGLKVEKI